MRFILLTFTIFLMVAIVYGQRSTDATTPGSVSRGPTQFDCNSPPKERTCPARDIEKQKRVHYDPKTKTCQLLQNNRCADNPLNQFTTISACKHKCIIGPKGSTPKSN